jgi:hypothetical protein
MSRSTSKQWQIPLIGNVQEAQNTNIEKNANIWRAQTHNELKKEPMALYLSHS